MNRQETHLQQRLTELRTKLLIMCATVGIALEEACEAFATGNLGRAGAVIEGDSAIDALENEIDALALALMVRSQPVAHDLRFVVAALRMVIDLERIGDEAASIAERTIIMNGLEELPAMTEMLGFASEARSFYREAVEAFRGNNAAGALQLCRMEDEMTQREVSVLHLIMDGLDSRGQPQIPHTALHSILVCRSLNRIARRAANIAEHAYFVAKGVSIKHTNVQKTVPE